MSRGIVSIDTNRIQEIMSDFSGLEGKVPLALSRAINRVTRSAKTEAVRQVRDEYTAKAGAINKTIKVTRANPNNLSAKIESRGSSMSLLDFRVNPKKPSPRRRSPITVEVRRGSKKPIEGAFVQRMGNGGVGVFARVGSARLPIRKLFGPAVPVMLNNDSVVEAVQRRAEEQLESRIGHEMNRVLGGGR